MQYKKDIPMDVDGQRVKFILVTCPPDLFDGEAAIYRRKRVPVWRIDAIKQSKDSKEIYAHLAALVPAWEGVVDVETEDVLPNPDTDPTIFGRLDTDQLMWIVKSLQTKPETGKFTSGQM